MTERAVNMAGLAKVACCSVTTVSLALRNSRKISRLTRENIQRLARQLGYRPNPLVSALVSTRKTTRTYKATLAILTGYDTPSDWKETYPAYHALLRGINDKAEELGYRCEEFWLREPGMSASRLVQILRARGISGIAVLPLPADGFTLPQFDWAHFSVVVVGYSVRTPAFHRVSHDYFHGMTTILRHCRDRGFRRIGFFLERRINCVVFNLWLAAYLAEQRTTAPGVCFEPLLYETGDESQVQAWVRDRAFDAIVGLDLAGLSKKGIQLPTEVALFSLNADEEHGLPGICRDFLSLGKAATIRLVSLLHTDERGPASPAHTTLIEGSWRESLRDFSGV